MEEEPVRSIVYFWWRKSEAENNILKFGDHTEPISNINWYKDTESYIQKTSAPREKKTFKDLIEYTILDVTQYAKKVGRNYKFAKIDNYISSHLGFEKYRLGKTDQFKLRKFEIDFEDFISAVDELTRERPNLNLAISVNELENLKKEKHVIFDFEKNPAVCAMSLIPVLKLSKVGIETNDQDIVFNIMTHYSQFNGYMLYNSNHTDTRFSFVDAIMVAPEIESRDLYDAIIKIENNKVTVNIK